MVLRSDKFDDVYFSADDGMAETHHVFLNGNNFPDAWQNKDNFTIAETGFGTGLNFLCAWKLFEETAQENQSLHFISVEKYPLSKSEIENALSKWQSELDVYFSQLLSLYPIRVPGPHHIRMTEQVSLTLWFGDVNDLIPEWTGHVDTWFLDGFTPAKNPDMWTDTLYQNMARLSHDKTTFATFTAAGDVRRGLEAAGFTIEKTKGFGRKRDMVKGHYSKGSHTPINKNKRIAIIGGGLAGCATAYIAQQNGFTPVIYEAGRALAVGASGGKLGMINPKLTAKPTPHSDYYTSAFANALRILPQLQDVDFNIHSSLHLCTDDDKDRRFTGYTENLEWHKDHIQRQESNLLYPDGASVSPEKLCRALAEGIDVHYITSIESMSELDTDYIVIANGYAANQLLNDDLPIHSVRGQVSWIKPQKNIDKNICFGGYITPQTQEGFHVLGSTFQPWDTDIAIKAEDHKDNIGRYNQAMDKDLSLDDVIGGWAALRTSSKDRFPIVGHLQDNIYISTAHGSHGIISSLYAAQILMSLIQKTHMPASQAVLKALSPTRFHKH